jgi:PRC-barrel domain
MHIGNIEDLMVDRGDNRIAYTVFSFGNHLLGIGNKYFAIPLEAFKYRQYEDDYVLDVDKSVLENADSLDRSKSLTQEELSKVYAQYGCKPYWEK